MQDEVRDKSVALVIRVGKTGGRLTADLLKWAMRRYLAQSKNPSIHHGKQTVKQLVGQGQGVQNIEITGKNIKSFEHVARKYGVDFALKKDPAQGKYLVFFKARDADALNAAFAEYTAKTLRRRAPEKPSLRQELARFKEMVRNEERDAAKNRDKGAVER
ncbi:PcfB family protein [Pseudoflavonifractor sp. 524-17]|uniref:PcfB family protein n=1 Tax=Pseudoflavonifractor sp. 524-17 TaxID=2304577 RepID=UPI0013799ED0|nr:PcfB family protein [Pseudoflavonifractor sp. 524-17]NCE64464.1 PcfB family protein [Pseudoflavonifractor sp. 524-17]